MTNYMDNYVHIPKGMCNMCGKKKAVHKLPEYGEGEDLEVCNGCLQVIANAEIFFEFKHLIGLN